MTTVAVRRYPLFLSDFILASLILRGMPFRCERQIALAHRRNRRDNSRSAARPSREACGKYRMRGKKISGARRARRTNTLSPLFRLYMCLQVTMGTARICRGPSRTPSRSAVHSRARKLAIAGQSSFFQADLKEERQLSQSIIMQWSNSMI